MKLLLVKKKSLCYCHQENNVMTWREYSNTSMDVNYLAQAGNMLKYESQLPEWQPVFWHAKSWLQH
jgi:hypothetical protein